MVNNSTNVKNNHPSLQLIEKWSTIPPLSTSLNELRWEVIFVDIGRIVDHHSMSWGERWLLLILVELLTLTQWVKVRGDFYWYWWNCCTSIHWVMVNNSTYINKNHLSSQLIEWWSTKPPISTNTTSQWVEVRGDFYWYWWNCCPSLNELRWEVIFVDIGGIVDHHTMN
jgi:hypothetical protein